MKKRLVATAAALAIASPVALVAAPAQASTDSTPSIADFTPRPSTFYPTVRDGFRDGVSFEGWAEYLEYEDEEGYWSSPDQSWTITIRNSNGRKVAQRGGGNAEDIWWAWNGKNQRTAEPVRVGTYKATLTVTNDDTGETDTRTRTLTATSDTVNKRFTKTRTGVDTSSRWRKGDCHVTRNGYFDGPRSLYLDCRGGRTGAVYGFVLPSDARKVTWGVSGSHGFGWDGRIIKTGKRIAPRRFRVAVTVTGWEAYSIKRARVTYTRTVKR